MYKLFPHYYDIIMMKFIQFKKCLIITKTFQLCHTIKLNGLIKFELHQLPKPTMGNDSK
jgi:hypothetical protein